MMIYLARWRMVWVAVVLVLVANTAFGQSAEGQKTENIIYVMLDGLRWQEVFCGADASRLADRKLSDREAAVVTQYSAGETAEARREALMPFFWSVVAKQGQIFGNQCKQSKAQVTNDFKFSFPGYSETLCGIADPRINSNSPGPNPNVTVLEWLHRKPAFQGRVAAFGFWGQFRDIINRERCGFCVNAAFDPMTESLDSPEMIFFNQLKAEFPQVWEDECQDALVFHMAKAYWKAKRPRVLFVALGETDIWGHECRYGEYLTAAHRGDQYLKDLWKLVQSMPEYQGKTTLIVSTDHGRGIGPEWTAHNADIGGSENIWMAFMGPDTAGLGERAETPTVTENQIAATLAALLGEDFCADVPQAGKPIADVLKSPAK